MEQHDGKTMKGVIELNWKIVVGIIAAVITIVLVILVLIGVLRTETLGKTINEFCNIIIGKVLNQENVTACNIFS